MTITCRTGSPTRKINRGVTEKKSEEYQLLDHIRVHAAVFPPPTVIRVLADVDLLADFRDTLSLANEHISLPELSHNLQPTVFLLHEITLSKIYLYCRLSSHEDWISFRGAKSDAGIRVPCLLFSCVIANNLAICSFP